MIRALATFYATVLGGYLFGLLLKDRVNAASKILAYLLLYVLLPLVVFKSLVDEANVFKGTIGVYAGFFALGVSTSFLLALIAFRGFDRRVRCTAVLSSTLRNVFFIPIALAISLGLPEEAVVGVVAFTVCYYLFQPGFTTLLALRMHGAYVTDVLLKGITFPPLRAAVVGLSLGMKGVPISVPAFKRIKLASSFLALFYVGLVLSKAPPAGRSDLGVIARVAAIRLLIVPLALLPLFLRRPYPENVVIARELGGPPNVSVVLYAVLFGFDDELTAKIVVYSTFFGMLALPLRFIILVRIQILLFTGRHARPHGSRRSPQAPRLRGRSGPEDRETTRAHGLNARERSHGGREAHT